MKHGIHPQYAPVAFRDKSGDLMFVSSSTLTSSETVEIDGVTYPVIDVEISTASHPFWTGKGRVLDTEGRVEKFNRRYGAAS
ncbi:type B 50S ribosomal protein L31 [Aeromicrobium sp.]|uniref:type B 50S ribosomal protein L31 n=1 Tax=Aeromicrobium sp. TaxID=1871063 RepID=UPI002FCC16EF